MDGHKLRAVYCDARAYRLGELFGQWPLLEEVCIGCYSVFEGTVGIRQSLMWACTRRETVV